MAQSHSLELVSVFRQFLMPSGVELVIISKPNCVEKYCELVFCLAKLRLQLTVVFFIKDAQWVSPEKWVIFINY